jgi:hypothetical protein
MRHVIVLVVHGIGDHSSFDLLHEMYRGATSEKSLKGIKLSTMSFPNFPQSNGTETQQISFRIRTRKILCNIIPIEWSRARVRGWRVIKDVPFHEGLPGFFALLALSIPSLLALCRDIMRCIPKLRSTLWRLAIAFSTLAAVILFLPFVFGILSLIFVLTIYIWQHWSIPISILVFVLMSLMLIPLAKRAMLMLDLIGDVAAYVGHPSHRSEMESRMVHIIKFVAELAPDAHILVVGHSLGSVLITHSLLSLSATTNWGKRIAVLTFGSPLRLMCWAFPKHISSPSEIWSQFEEKTMVSFWANLWRDGDLIGQSLMKDVGQRFGEMSLGDGPHCGYWHDSRLWGTVAFLVTDGMEAFRRAAAFWRTARLNSNEVRDRAVGYTRLMLLSISAAVLWVVPIPGFKHIFDPALSALPENWTLTSLRVLYVIGICLGVMVTIIDALVWRFVFTKGVTVREQLARLRLLKAPLQMLFNALMFIWAAIHILRIYLVGGSFPLY